MSKFRVKSLEPAKDFLAFKEQFEDNFETENVTPEIGHRLI